MLAAQLRDVVGVLHRDCVVPSAVEPAAVAETRQALAAELARTVRDIHSSAALLPPVSQLPLPTALEWAQLAERSAAATQRLQAEHAAAKAQLARVREAITLLSTVFLQRTEQAGAETGERDVVVVVQGAVVAVERAKRTQRADDEQPAADGRCVWTGHCRWGQESV